MEWRNAIARVEVIHNADVTHRGTAFLVSRDLVLTALHVVADRSSTAGLVLYPGEIKLTFFFPDDSQKRKRREQHETSGKVVNSCWNLPQDWILLKCTVPPRKTKPLPLVRHADDGSRWKTYGFPDDKPDHFETTGTLTSSSGQLKDPPQGEDHR